MNRRDFLYFTAAGPAFIHLAGCSSPKTRSVPHGSGLAALAGMEVAFERRAPEQAGIKEPAAGDPASAGIETHLPAWMEILPEGDYLIQKIGTRIANGDVFLNVVHFPEIRSPVSPAQVTYLGNMSIDIMRLHSGFLGILKLQDRFEEDIAILGNICPEIAQLKFVKRVIPFSQCLAWHA